MLLREYRKYFIDTLTPLYDKEEAEGFFNLTLNEFTGWRRVDVALNPKETLDAEKLAKWDDVLEQLKTYRPVQYIFGKVYFHNMMLKVNENTLIPRVETDQLVEWIISDNEDKPVKILDIGTGSGCIAVALAKNIVGSAVSAMDISAGALEVAKLNAETQEVSVNFIKQDVLALDALTETYDIIVSNPPYVRNLEKESMMPNVTDFEPHIALFVEDNDPLVFYKKIAQLAKKALNPGGKLFFEINEAFGYEMAEMLEQAGFEKIHLHIDLFDKDRMIKAMV